LSQFYPTEDKFLKEWFSSIIHSYECDGTTELSVFRNYEINYEFEQPKEYLNRVLFLDGSRHVILIAQKITVEYLTAKSIFAGYPTIRIIKKRKTRKPAMIHG
ncbi:MAG: hypothetical protein C0490_12230, partial [Marivirga sp.]|nr:hypothetical protein [Marivirga sp.]